MKAASQPGHFIFLPLTLAETFKRFWQCGQITSPGSGAALAGVKAGPAAPVAGAAWADAARASRGVMVAARSSE